MSQPLPFDRTLLARRRARALEANVAGADFLVRLAAEDLDERLAALSRRFGLAVDLSAQGGLAAQALQRSGKVDRILRGDPLVADPRGGVPAADFIFDDAIPPLADGSVDLVTSLLSLHFVNDLPGALVQIRRALNPDGLFLGALIGGDSLHELREVMMQAEIETSDGASPRVLPFADVRDLGGLLQRAGFALPVTDLDRLTVRYDSLFALLRDLRAMGATSILTDRSRRPLTRRVFQRAAELYAERHADPDGRIRATFTLVSLSGWAPHESQQKPLKPGSARMRLADALAPLEKPSD